VGLSLQSQIGHYVRSETQLDNAKLRRLALDHLTLTCQLWQVFLAESVRPDLLQHLQGLGSATQLQSIFFRELEDSFRGRAQMPQCLAYLDLLIVAAQSQPRFLEMLLKSDPSRKKAVDQLCAAILKQLREAPANEDILMKEQQLHIKFKVTALLSCLAKKRLCIEVVSHNDGAFLGALMQHVVVEECFKRVHEQRFSLNAGFLEPVVSLDARFEEAQNAFNFQTRSVSNHCLAKVTVCLF